MQRDTHTASGSTYTFQNENIYMMEQLEEFLMDDVERGSVVLADHHFWSPGAESLSERVDHDQYHDSSTTTGLSSSTGTTTLDHEWWDDGLILKEVLDGLLDIPSILSEEDNTDIHAHNQQELDTADLFIDYFTNDIIDQEAEDRTINGSTTDHQQHEKEQQQQQQQHQTDQQHAYININEEKEEEMMKMDELQAEMGTSDSKNLFSERNRRKRLNNQLLTLRSIVPNITKMDKRSILVDALAYLQSILQQTEAEMEKINSSSVDQELVGSSLSVTSSSNVENIVLMNAPPAPPIFQPPPPPPYESCAALPAISKIGVEKLDDEGFILKIEFNKALGAMGQVQRSIEMLDMEFTNISVYEQDEHHMETMNFLRVKKKGLLLTEEDLLQNIQKSAKQLGLLFVTDH